MESFRTLLLSVLEEVRHMSFDTFFIADMPTVFPPSGIHIQSPRFILPLSAPKDMDYFSDSGIQHQTFHPGEVLLCRHLAWTREYWDTPHRMLSVVFFDHYIRFLYINNHTNSANDMELEKYFYHTTCPASIVIRDIARSLYGNPISSSTRYYLFKALIEELYEHLASESDIVEKREYVLIENAKAYIESNIDVNIGRDNVAAAIHISSSYLTLLLRKYCHCGFSAFLLKQRMELAELLLAENNYSVSEISSLCGFPYPSYFIRLFRKRNGITPRVFQERNKKQSSR